ncbi:MAG: hypothetical protein ACXVB6_14530, partial [Mucilaginibacter sp.]
MSKPITLIACFIFLLLGNIAFAQDELTLALAKDSKKDTKTINILSLDGKNRKAHIMPDYANRELNISCLKDTISIEGAGHAEERVLDNRFVQICYDVRGGSNFALGNMLIICVNGDRLYEALHIVRYATWDSNDLIKYKVKMTFG